MEYVIQLSQKRKNHTLLQLSVLAILIVGAMVYEGYEGINEYFGVDQHWSDRVWFYSFFAVALFGVLLCSSVTFN
jgi:hypothetical protein